MSSRVGTRRAVLAVVGVLAVIGCGQEPKRVAQAPPPADEQAVAPPTPVKSAPPMNQDDEPFTPPVPPKITPGGLPAKPMPGEFVAPSSPTFTPPEALPGTQLPGTPPTVPPAVPPTTPAPPAPMTGTVPVVPQPEPPKPAVPPTTPEPPTTTPKKPEYPEFIGGRDLKSWLKELEYTGGGPVQKDDQMREAAVKVIPDFGPASRKLSVRPLIEAIRADPDPGVQVAAITVVSNMGFDMREEVKPVIAVLQNKLNAAAGGNIVKMYCVRSLASFGSDAASSIPYFKQSCLDPSWETRREIAIALSMVGGSPPEKDGKPKAKAEPDERAIDVLMDYQLQDRSVAVRLEAVK